MKITAKGLRQIIREELNEMYSGYATGRRPPMGRERRVLRVVFDNPAAGPSLYIDGALTPVPESMVLSPNPKDMESHKAIIRWALDRGVTDVETDFLAGIGFRVNRGITIPLVSPPGTEGDLRGSYGALVQNYVRNMRDRYREEAIAAGNFPAPAERGRSLSPFPGSGPDSDDIDYADPQGPVGSYFAMSGQYPPRRTY